jgi:hypothetical protein
MYRIDFLTLIPSIECLPRATHRNLLRRVFPTIPLLIEARTLGHTGDTLPGKFDREYPRCKCGKVFSDIASLNDHTPFCTVYKDQHPSTVSTESPKPKPVRHYKPKPAHSPPTEKICIECGIVKPISEFQKAPNADGYKNWCNDCVRAYYKRWREKKAEMVSA